VTYVICTFLRYVISNLDRDILMVNIKLYRTVSNIMNDERFIKLLPIYCVMYYDISVFAVAFFVLLYSCVKQK